MTACWWILGSCLAVAAYSAWLDLYKKVKKLTGLKVSFEHLFYHPKVNAIVGKLWFQNDSGSQRLITSVEFIRRILGNQKETRIFQPTSSKVEFPIRLNADDKEFVDVALDIRDDWKDLLKVGSQWGLRIGVTDPSGVIVRTPIYGLLFTVADDGKTEYQTGPCVRGVSLEKQSMSSENPPYDTYG